MKFLKDFVSWFFLTPFIVAGLFLAISIVVFAFIGWLIILIEGWPWWTWLIWWLCVVSFITVGAYSPEDSFYIEDLY